MKLLTDTGYIEVIKKGWRGERSNTVRVIFDQTIDAETAMAVTNTIEDTRPPAIKEQQMQEEIDKQSQQRIAKMVAGALRSTNQPKERTMPKQGETSTVKKMKEEIAKAKAKRTHKQPAEVAIGTVAETVQKDSHRQPDRQLPEVAQNAEEQVLKDSIKESKVKEDINNKNSYGVLSNLEVAELKSHGLTDAQIADALDTLLPAYKAEGLTPTSRLLADSILQLSRDVR